MRVRCVVCWCVCARASLICLLSDIVASLCAASLNGRLCLDRFASCCFVCMICVCIVVCFVSLFGRSALLCCGAFWMHGCRYGRKWAQRQQQHFGLSAASVRRQQVTSLRSCGSTPGERDVMWIRKTGENPSRISTCPAETQW